ncbi:LPS export ABC transporter ATP-binding protein [bacterium]|nr:LPS export ABC transporter ATP-binding protein [bacterium]NIN92414.1 LPS export ABC transporter ATP-binding protein [bacterium]NIO18528.1 LPS export ABC transporter ATP-binding protein [bacterium]NIO73524.1 LPS export ABC transporter ATP-binding protein [bacterium]
MSLLASGLVKTYSHRKIVDDVEIEINPGEIVGLLGPNGAGKTTTFYMIVGLLRPDQGRIFLEGKDVTELPMYKRARQGIGYLSQEPSIFRRLSVRENIWAILETTTLTQSEKKEKLESLLRELGVKHLAENKACLLSGGEKRRVEISRALVTTPQYILLDEPFVGIDPITTVEIQQIVARLKNNGLGVLVTDHNVRETLEIIDRAYIMYEGKILLSGTAKELLESEEARKVYLGKKFRM